MDDITSTIHPQYIVDEKGRANSVILPIAEFEALLERLDAEEDLRCLREALAGLLELEDLEGVGQRLGLED